MLIKLTRALEKMTPTSERAINGRVINNSNYSNSYRPNNREN